ncbi:MAG: MarR family transcriptional regulator [Clostridia bacterium]|nr:MarR family transcriptional regulator [Clostridia bacterium]
MDTLKKEMLKLDNQLCFSLYATAKEIIRRYKPLLDNFDITYTQYITLLVLWERDGLLVKSLGERLYLDSGTLTPLLRKLESKGYILKKKDTKDSRETAVYLTDKGRKLKEKIVVVPATMGACVKLESDDFLLLQRLLKKVRNGLAAE